MVKSDLKEKNNILNLSRTKNTNSNALEKTGLFKEEFTSKEDLSNDRSTQESTNSTKSTINGSIINKLNNINQKSNINNDNDTNNTKTDCIDNK